MSEEEVPIGASAMPKENLTQNETKAILATFSGSTDDNQVEQQQQKQLSLGNQSKLLLSKINSANKLQIPDFLRNNWDPLNCPEWDLEKPSQNCLHRIKK
jgi:hypothetical protein